ncbi:MAG TPA: NAD(P)H-binding protein, partial [Reyranella sp.]|nr:NAD(P)H-binding protein [Reyranella sp.]
MTVMIVGATGFIGSAVAHGLAQAGAQVVGVSRGRPRTALPMRHVALDIARAVEPGAWTPLLAGIDAVVYCAGTLQDSPGESLRAVHETGPAALFAACARAGVRRVVHLSALGVERSATPFSGSKRAGDRALMDSDLDWVILRPSVVIGADAFGGAALLRGLAAL